MKRVLMSAAIVFATLAPLPSLAAEVPMSSPITHVSASASWGSSGNITRAPMTKLASENCPEGKLRDGCRCDGPSHCVLNCTSKKMRCDGSGYCVCSGD
jgi:hypothetical protein